MPCLYRLFVALFVIALSSTLFSSAVVADVDEATRNKIVNGLKQWRSDLEYTNFRETPMPGMYYVQIVGGPSLYVSADGKFLMEGDLFEVKAGHLVSWKEKMLAPMRRDLIRHAKVDDMVIFKPEGDAKAIMYVFTDIDCGFCRRLHGEVPALNKMGVEVRYLGFPRAGLGTESSRKLETVWCSDNPQKTLTRMKAGEDVEPKTCETTAIKEHMKLVHQMGINATPAIVLADGTLVSGYRRAGELKEILGI